jgi:hypothetical protein
VRRAQKQNRTSSVANPRGLYDDYCRALLGWTGEGARPHTVIVIIFPDSGHSRYESILAFRKPLSALN